MNVPAIPSFLTAAMKLSVPINGVFVPFNQAVTNLQRFCRPLLFHNDCSVFDLSYSGSCFLFRHGGRNIMLCTRHQIVNQSRDPKDVALVIEETDGRKVALGPNEFSRVIANVPQQSKLEDIFLAEYESERNGRKIEAQFLQLDLDTIADLRIVAEEQVVLIFAIGYPSRFSSFETSIDEVDGSATGLDVISRWVKLYLELAEPSNWDHDLRVPLQTHHHYHADIGDPDGFSGSPVFFVYQDESKQAHLGFAGMLTDANKSGRFMLYEAAHIREIVKGSSKIAAEPT